MLQRLAIYNFAENWDDIVNAIEKTLALRENRTKDLQGSCSTKKCTDAILKNI